MTVAGDLAISDGATLKVLGLTSSSGNSTLTITTSGANNTITLPAGAGSLTVVLPDDYSGELTLTLGNVDSSGVSGADIAAKLMTLLASVQVKDASASTTGYVSLSGDNPTGTLFNLVLAINLVSDWANNGTTATLSAGTYTIAANDSVTVTHLMLTGGELAGAGSGASQGKLVLTGASTLTWSGGSISAVIDASDSNGADTLKLTPASGVTLTLAGGLFKGFELLTKSGAGTISQSGVLTIGNSATLSAGTYSLATAAELRVADFTIEGGSLSGNGKVVLTGASTFYVKGGTVGVTVDADNGTGDDKIEVTAPSSAGLSLMGSRLVGFEVLSVQGSYGLTWQGNFAFGSSGYHTLELRANTAAAPFTVAGNLAIGSGATLKVQGLTSASGDSSLTLTTSGANNTITLPAVAGGLTVVLPDDYTGVLTLTLGNVNSSGVSGADLAAKLVTLLASVQVKDASASTTGHVSLSGDNPTGTLFNLVLAINLVSDWANNGTTATLSAGTYTIAAGSSDTAQYLTVTGGVLTGAGSDANQGKVELTGVSTFTWSGGSISAVIDASDGSGDDTLKLIPASGVTLTLAGGLFKGFEVLTKEGAGSVSQSGTLTIENSATLSAGTYSLATAAELRVADLTIEGGSLSGDGKVVLTGASTFTWIGGSISAVIDASDDSGSDTLNIAHTSGELTIDGKYFSGFEVFTKASTRRVKLMGTLKIATSATWSKGIYEFLEGSVMEVPTFTLERGILKGLGKLALIGDSTFYVKGGTVGVTVDASDGDGDDRIEVTAPSAGLSLTGSYLTGFEVLSVQGSYGLTWQGNFAFGSGGYHTLELVAGTSATPFTVAGDLIISDGATLKVQGLVSSSVNTTLTLTTSGSGNVITLPAVAGGLTVVLPDDYTGVLTLTLGNVNSSGVSGANLAAKLAKILASIQIKNVSGGNGYFDLSGSNPATSLFNLVLAISLVSDWVNDNTTATITKGTYIIDESASETAQHLTVTGGELAGAGSGASQGKVVLTGVSTFTWSAGTISAVIDASDASGDDTLKLTPASGTLTLDGSLFKGFEVLTKSGAGSVSQSGVLSIATSATLSAGTYSLASGAELQVTDLTIGGGILSGAGKVVLTGASTFTWSGGSVSAVIDASDSSGADTLKLIPASGTLSLDGSLFKGFELLTKSGAGTISQSGVLTIGNSATLSAGTYSLASGAELRVSSFTIDGGSLSGAGKVAISGDSTFYVKGGTVGATVDASDGKGDDRIEVTAPSAGLSLTGSYLTGFEVLSVQGNHGLSWQGNFAFGSSGYHTLELRAGTAAVPLTVVGDLTISDGATLKVLGLTSASGDSTLTLTTSGERCHYFTRRSRRLNGGITR